MSSLVRRLGLRQKHQEPQVVRVESKESKSNNDVKLTELATHSTGSDTQQYQEVEANQQLRRIQEKHRWDPNLPEELEEGIEDATDHHNLSQELGLVDELMENSPYPEVRSAVRNVSAFDYHV